MGIPRSALSQGWIREGGTENSENSYITSLSLLSGSAFPENSEE